MMTAVETKTARELLSIPVQRMTVLKFGRCQVKFPEGDECQAILRKLKAAEFEWDEGYGAWTLKAGQSKTYRTVMVFPVSE